MRRGLARSRGDARDLVGSGAVVVDGSTARKAAQPVAESARIELTDAAPRWVGRGAGKLQGALEAWGPRGLTARDRRCIDVGASTGGFTQVLLAEGAAHVVALDVGHDQLVAELAADPRVQDRSGTTVRGLAPADVGGPADLVVVDLSFISLTLVAAELAGLVAGDGDLVVLVKPQFEVGRRRLGRRGVVTDPGDRADALREVLSALVGAGLHVRDVRVSPVTGGTGNVEYLVWVRSDPSDTMTEDEVAAAVAATTRTTTGGGR